MLSVKMLHNYIFIMQVDYSTLFTSKETKQNLLTHKKLKHFLLLAHIRICVYQCVCVCVCVLCVYIKKTHGSI